MSRSCPQSCNCTLSRFKMIQGDGSTAVAGGLLTLHTFLREVLFFIGYRRLCMLHSSHMATQSCSTYDRNQRS